jgi:hypothetical protein
MRQLKPLSKFYLVAFALFVALTSVTAQQPMRARRVLFIGNSYTYFNNLPQMLTGLAKAAQPAQTLEAEMVTVGGATLKRLWEQGEALAAIKRGGWAFVVLQEQSTLGNAPMVDGKPQIADPKTFHEYARLFDAEIKIGGRANGLLFDLGATKRARNTGTIDSGVLDNCQRTQGDTCAGWSGLGGSVEKTATVGIAHRRQEPSDGGGYVLGCLCVLRHAYRPHTCRLTEHRDGHTG